MAQFIIEKLEEGVRGRPLRTSARQIGTIFTETGSLVGHFSWKVRIGRVACDSGRMVQSETEQKFGRVGRSVYAEERATPRLPRVGGAEIREHEGRNAVQKSSVSVQ